MRPATASAPAGSTIGAAGVEDVLDSSADLVVVDADDLVDRRADERERVPAHSPHGDPIGKQPHVVDVDRLTGRERPAHGVGIGRLDADDLHVRHEGLEVGAHPGNQSAAADRHKDGR